MAKLYIVRGLPGSGKTTFAKSLNILHVERDLFCMRGGKYDWKAEELSRNNELCKAVISMALLNGNDCVVCNPFPKKTQVQEYIDLAVSFGADWEVIRMTGEYGSVHGVPKEHMKKFASEFETFDNEKLI